MVLAGVGQGWVGWWRGPCGWQGTDTETGGGRWSPGPGNWNLRQRLALPFGVTSRWNWAACFRHQKLTVCFSCDNTNASLVELQGKDMLGRSHAAETGLPGSTATQLQDCRSQLLQTPPRLLQLFKYCSPGLVTASGVLSR